MTPEHPTVVRARREALWCVPAQRTVVRLGFVGTQYLGPVVNSRAVVELNGLKCVVPAVYCSYRAALTCSHRGRH